MCDQTHDKATQIDFKDRAYLVFFQTFKFWVIYGPKTLAVGSCDAWPPVNHILWLQRNDHMNSSSHIRHRVLSAGQYEPSIGSAVAHIVVALINDLRPNVFEEENGAFALGKRKSFSTQRFSEGIGNEKTIKKTKSTLDRRDGVAPLSSCTL